MWTCYLVVLFDFLLKGVEPLPLPVVNEVLVLSEVVGNIPLPLFDSDLRFVAVVEIVVVAVVGIFVVAIVEVFFLCILGRG